MVLGPEIPSSTSDGNGPPDPNAWIAGAFFEPATADHRCSLRDNTYAIENSAAAITAARPPLIACVIPARRSFVSDARAGTARGNLAASSLQATYACFSSPAPTRDPRGDADAMALPPDLDPPTLLVSLTRLVERVIALDAAAPWHPMSRPDPISAFLTTLNPRFTVSRGSASSLVAPRLRLDAPVRVTRRVRVAIPLNAALARM